MQLKIFNTYEDLIKTSLFPSFNVIEETDYIPIVQYNDKSTKEDTNLNLPTCRIPSE